MRGSTRRPGSSSSPTRAARWTGRPGPRVSASSTPTRTSAAGTRRSRRSGSCRAAWPVPTSRPCSTTPRRSSDLLAEDDEANPALRLGAAMAGTEPLRDKLVLVDAGTENVGFGAWAEQLIAESTGKDGTGILPVVAIGNAPAHLYDDGTVVRLVASGGADDAGLDDVPADTAASRRHRRRPARGPGHALGGRHGRRRAPARHQPVRPARRRERQGRGPRAARGRNRRG